MKIYVLMKNSKVLEYEEFSTTISIFSVGSKFSKMPKELK